MTIIHRVCLPGQINKGMYFSRKSEVMDELYDEYRHPTPSDDASLGWDKLTYAERDKYWFGFATMAQLRSWIYKREWRTKIAEDGFIIVTLEAEEVKRGDTQAMFNSRKAYRVIEEKSLLDL